MTAERRATGPAKTRTETVGERELRLTRLIDAPREAVWRAWTDPDLLRRWFAPLPYTTPVAELDLRPGGANYIVMQSPAGQRMPNRGVYLEVVPGERLVFTDAYTDGWTPREGKPFMTVVVTLEDEGGQTRYTARVLHWTREDRETHEQMGFHQGWAVCTEQLAALVEGTA
jgi:uncharacterized protein YndB with AHSA1/START domain